jgi:hypothetical protein
MIKIKERMKAMLKASTRKITEDAARKILEDHGQESRPRTVAVVAGYAADIEGVTEMPRRSAKTKKKNLQKKLKMSEQDAATCKRFAAYVVDPPKTSRLFEISPVVAQFILDKYDKGNRSKRETAIRGYSADMADGHWVVTGETMVISDARLLRDGQNRCVACVRSGASFTTHVIFGVDDGVFPYLGGAPRRTAADVLKIGGYPNATVLAAALRWASILLSDNPFSRRGVSGVACLDLIEKGGYAMMSDSVNETRKVYTMFRHPHGQLAALHFIFSKSDPLLADSFFDSWARGVQGGRARPVAKLQDALIKIKQDSSVLNYKEAVRAALIIKAWNSFVEKKAGRGATHYNVGESFPEVL